MNPEAIGLVGLTDNERRAGLADSAQEGGPSFVCAILLGIGSGGRFNGRVVREVIGHKLRVLVIVFGGLFLSDTPYLGLFGGGCVGFDSGLVAGIGRPVTPSENLTCVR